MEDDFCQVKCLVSGCTSILRRGKAGSKRGDLNSNNMLRHVQTKHPEEWRQIEEEEKQAAEADKEEKERDGKKDESEKGGNQIWCLKSHKERMTFFKRICKQYSYRWEY